MIDWLSVCLSVVKAIT